MREPEASAGLVRISVSSDYLVRGPDAEGHAVAVGLGEGEVVVGLIGDVALVRAALFGGEFQGVLEVGRPVDDGVRVFEVFAVPVLGPVLGAHARCSWKGVGELR